MRANNPAAFKLYLQGRFFFDRSTREDLEKAVSYYQQALKLDPGYSLVWLGLAVTHYSQADSGYVPFDEGFPKARREVERALTLDPNLAEAHAALGDITRAYAWDWTGADAAFKRALELEPGNAEVVTR